MAIASKIYDFPMEKVQNQLVGWLKRSRGSSTVADMISGTGLPKYQVEQAAKRVLDEYAGRLKVTESGELLYSFPEGMRSTVHGAGPAFRRFLRAFAHRAARVLSLLFKIWIVVMLVGYFVAFVAIVVLAIAASFAASMAARSNGRDGGGGGRGRGGGFGGMYLVIRLFELILRMWFWTNLLGGFGGQQRKKRPEGRAFYKSVFGFVFGEGDPNAGWDEAERRYVLSYIVSHKGVITIEELMALTGREPDEANALVNRFLLEYEGEPGVTEEGTVTYTFPALMRTSRLDNPRPAPLLNPDSKRLVPFSANKPRTNGWIIFFNAFNLAFGSYFLGARIVQGSAAIVSTAGTLYSYTGSLLAAAGVPAVAFLVGTVLGIIPVTFSVLFFLVPLFRSMRLRRLNTRIREESLRKRVLTQILANPGHVDPAQVASSGSALDPRDLPVAARRIVEKLAAALNAEPIAKEKEGEFLYRFADLEKFRNSIDLKKYELGETVFDTGR